MSYELCGDLASLVEILTIGKMERAVGTVVPPALSIKTH